ncbi:hypothetical protein H206_05239 [Candidatus Electrothrix aarhusensis]|uniref:Uncharacterized protein n=1 Tax=Candidatus Electrothrix aarhusensis TaxID=1859131 RepID=A0A444J542_9BACT|nr:hypothetical protein H206_05239 [Candidatus Electrothrix aarhusensis]
MLETSLTSDKSLGYDRMSLQDNSPGGTAANSPLF